MNLIKKTASNPYTLESLIEGLDERGMLVIQVLLGQHAFSLLENTKVKEVTGISKDSGLIVPGAEGIL